MIDMPPKNREATGGFTLIEVLVAFTIAALMLGALSQVYSTGIGAVARARASKEALMIAQSSLEELGLGEILRPRETTDRVGEKYVRSLIIRARGDYGSEAKSGPQFVVYQVEVVVSWRDALQTRSVSLQSMRLARRS
jgi:general secretion pathway protein I